MKFWVLIVKKFRKTHLPTDLHDISLDRYEYWRFSRGHSSLENLYHTMSEI